MGDLTPNKVVGPILPVNTWSLVTGVYDSAVGELRLYINGTLSAVERVTGPIVMGAGALNFSPAGNYYQGELDDVRFYNRALTTAEIQQLFPMENGTPTTPTPLPSITPTSTSPATFTPTVTALPVGAQQWGLGNHGDLTVSGTFNLNTDTNGFGGRTCADSISYNVTSLGSTVAYLSTTAVDSCLNAGDEIMLIHVLGSNISDNYNAGVYEFLRVASVSGNSVMFTTMKSRWYGDGFHSDANIGTGTDQQRVMLIRVPNYANVTVADGSKITANPFAGYKDGVIVFRVSGLLSGAGAISADSIGFVGLDLGYPLNASGYSAGGQAPYNNWGFSGGGGGGGHATAGGVGANGNGDGIGGAGGSVLYGAPPLDKLFFGSGGGGTAVSWSQGMCGNPPTACWEYTDGPSGGAGGGIVFVSAQMINFWRSDYGQRYG